MIGILFTSRNNYPMLSDWCKKVDRENFITLNIDEDSTPKNKELGSKICSDNNIVYMNREERGMQNNMVTAINYFKSKGVKWIIWFQHDCWPLTDNFFSKLSKLISTGKLDTFGTIGFNVFDSQREINLYYNGDRSLKTTARCPLEPGDFWYRSKQIWPNTAVDYNHEGFQKPFAVESIAWLSVGLNIDLFEKHIIPTDDYHFFHAWDDMCFQFLYNNIYNVVLPSFCVAHNQALKVKHGIPKNSPKSDEKTREFYHSKWGHHKVWKDRWGFDYGDRNTFEAVKDQYRGTLLYEFYNHDPANGPLCSFDL